MAKDLPVLNNLLTKAAESILTDVWLVLMIEEVYFEPRYKHWWQGWLDIRRTYWEDEDDGSVFWTVRWKGQRLIDLSETETFWDSNGDEDWSWEEIKSFTWRELFRPQNQRTRLVPVGDLIGPVSFTPDGLGALTIEPIKVGLTVAGNYRAVKVINDRVELIAEIPIQGVDDVLKGDELDLQPRISISS